LLHGRCWTGRYDYHIFEGNIENVTDG
jgi:argininosuccinate synthase